MQRKNYNLGFDNLRHNMVGTWLWPENTYYNTEYAQNKTSHRCTRNHMMGTRQHIVQHRACTK
jgi:hypothetical protein